MHVYDMDTYSQEQNSKMMMVNFGGEIRRKQISTTCLVQCIYCVGFLTLKANLELLNGDQTKMYLTYERDKQINNRVSVPW